MSVFRQQAARPVLSGTAVWRPWRLFSDGEAGVWYDPSDLSTMWQDAAGTVAAAVDQPVGRILDKSGNGKHATQGTAAARPILRLVGGLYYLEFDGVDDSMVTATAAGLTGPVVTTIGGWLTTTVAAAYRMIWDSNRYSWGNVTDSTHFTTNGLQNYVGPAASITANTRYVVGSVFDAGFDVQHRKNGANNGALLAGSGDGVDADAVFRLGSNPSGANFWTGNIYQLIVIKRALTAQENADAEAYTNTKTGAY